MQISDDRWARINELSNSALELPPGERAAYLDAECAGEPGVRKEVEALLRADAEGPEFLEGDVISFAGPIDQATSPRAWLLRRAKNCEPHCHSPDTCSRFP